MDSLLRDLYSHQQWADAQYWHAIEQYAPAQTDPAIRNRLHHIHLVQRAFMWAARDRRIEFEMSKPEDFPTHDDLKRFARETHAIIDQFLSQLTDARLTEQIAVPWFKDPPLTLTVSEALTQCVMHSQWHRGQNAMRLRELGGDPPAMDLIFWYWKGRPAAQW